MYVEKGTVAYQALNSAQILGFSKIIVVGQDLAYLDNRCYSADSSYGELIYEYDEKTKEITFKIKDEEKMIASCYNKGFATNKIRTATLGLDFVKGVRGDMLPTFKSYAAFYKFFKWICAC